MALTADQHFKRRKIEDEPQDDASEDIQPQSFVIPQFRGGLGDAGREEWFHLWHLLVQEGTARVGLAPLVKNVCRMYDRAAAIQEELDRIEDEGGSIISSTAHGPKLNPLEVQYDKTLKSIESGLRQLGLVVTKSSSESSSSLSPREKPPTRNRGASFGLPLPEEE